MSMIQPLFNITTGNAPSGTPDITSIHREQTARKHQALYNVEVHERVLGTRQGWNSDGASKRRKLYKGEAKMYDVQWEDTLQQALYYDPSMYTHIRKSRAKWKSERDMDYNAPGWTLRDYMDALAWRDHDRLGDKAFPANDDEPDRLAFALYYDAVSLPNQLGAFKHEHKLGLFYVILLNLPPQLRGKVRNIWLSSVVLEPDLKEFGPEMVICGNPGQPPDEGSCIRATLNRFRNGIKLKVLATELSYCCMSARMHESARSDSVASEKTHCRSSTLRVLVPSTLSFSFCTCLSQVPVAHLKAPTKREVLLRRNLFMDFSLRNVDVLLRRQTRLLIHLFEEFLPIRWWTRCTRATCSYFLQTLWGSLKSLASSPYPHLLVFICTLVCV